MRGRARACAPWLGGGINGGLQPGITAQALRRMTLDPCQPALADDDAYDVLEIKDLRHLLTPRCGGACWGCCTHPACCMHACGCMQRNGRPDATPPPALPPQSQPICNDQQLWWRLRWVPHAAGTASSAALTARSASRPRYRLPVTAQLCITLRPAALVHALSATAIMAACCYMHAMPASCGPRPAAC